MIPWTRRLATTRPDRIERERSLSTIDGFLPTAIRMARKTRLQGLHSCWSLLSDGNDKWRFVLNCEINWPRLEFQRRGMHVFLAECHIGVQHIDCFQSIFNPAFLGQQ